MEADSPVGVYRKIADEIVALRPCPARYPKAAAESSRAFLMIRLGLHLGFRQKNLRQLMLCPKGEPHTLDRRLADQGRGELRWSERDQGWEVFVPSSAFKNSRSTFFGGRPFRLVLPDIASLYAEIEAYVTMHRGRLLGPARDPGTFFVKTVKSTSASAAYDQIGTDQLPTVVRRDSNFLQIRLLFERRNHQSHQQAWTNPFALDDREV